MSTKTKYTRTLEELSQVASMFWSDELSERAAKLSIIPKLLHTQEDFISILSVPVDNIDGLFGVLSSSNMPANLFLKHLVILADFGGEMLQRINQQFNMIYPDNTMEYIWNSTPQKYVFNELPLQVNLTNSKLGISEKKLFKPKKLDNLYKDVIALLILGSASTDSKAASILSKCEIGDYLGKPDQLEKFIKQRYIWVSRITSGSKSNNLGQIAQKFVEEYLKDHLGIEGVEIQTNGNMPGITHTSESDTRLTTFDLVISKNDMYIGVEVSFQVTTNSVIERKSGQAQSRYQQIEQKGYKVAYILDGAGNFQRKNALTTILAHSHCSVALSHSELDLLCQFIKENLE